MDAPNDVVGRVSALLRAVSAREPDGATTSEVARTAGLARPTAHRLLSSLAGRGSRRARAGRAAGCSARSSTCSAPPPRRATTSPRWPSPSYAACPIATGESAFFSARRGDETVCLSARTAASRSARTSCTRASGSRWGSRPPGWRSWPSSPTPRSRPISPAPISPAEYGPRTSRRDPGAGRAHPGHRLRAQPRADRGGQLGNGRRGLRRRGAPAVGAQPDRHPAALRGARRRELGELLLREAHVLSRTLRPRA